MKSDADSTADLTRRLRSGDPSAYQEFYDKYGLLMMRYLVSLHGGDSESAKDTFQKAVLRVAKHIKIFPGEAVFWNWLQCVAKTAFIDETRKASRYRRLLAKFGVEARVGTRPPDDGGVRSALAESLLELDPLAAGLIEDFYFKDLSYSEIGQLHGISERAVEGRLARARAALRDLMKRRVKS